MRILQVISSFPPAYAYGGPAKVAYEISKELVKKGHEVTVYTTDVYDAHSRFKYNENPMWMDGIGVYHFRNVSNKLAHRENLATAPEMAIALNKNIKDFDIVHLHEYRSFQTMLIHHYAKKYRIPYVLQAHGSLPRIIEKQRLKKLYDWVWGNKILKDAYRVIALTKTEAMQCKVMGVDEDKIEIVPNGVNLSEYENLPEKWEFKRRYLMGDDEKVILYLGRIHKTKGLDLLVNTFAELSKKLKNVKLIIVGPDDGGSSTLKKRIDDLGINDRVLFTGPLYGMNKLKAYIDADVFVTPSFSGFPVTFLEACACGTPIIMTNNGDKLDWVHGKVGYVVEYDKDQLRDAIFEILSDEGLSRRFGEEGRRLVIKEFDWSEIVGGVENVYKRAQNMEVVNVEAKH